MARAVAADSDRVLKLRDGAVAWRQVEDEMVLLDLERSVYLATNTAATLLWHRLEEGATESQLVDALVDAYEIPRERAATDADAFLADCRRRNLLDAEPGQR